LNFILETGSQPIASQTTHIAEWRPEVLFKDGHNHPNVSDPLKLQPNITSNSEIKAGGEKPIEPSKNHQQQQPQPAIDLTKYFTSQALAEALFAGGAVGQPQPFLIQLSSQLKAATESGTNYAFPGKTMDELKVCLFSTFFISYQTCQTFQLQQFLNKH